MLRRFTGRFGVAAAVAVLVLSLGAGAVMAGEVTGSGKNIDQNQGKSWCSFSGHNDDPGAPLDGSGPNGPGGRSQSFGQDVKLGLADPHAGNPRRAVEEGVHGRVGAEQRRAIAVCQPRGKDDAEPGEH